MQKSQPAGAKSSHLVIFLRRKLFSMYLDTVSTFHPTSGINQLYFIPCVAVSWLFYHCLSSCNEPFSAPSIARFIVRSHFCTMSACSKAYARLVQLAPTHLLSYAYIATAHASGLLRLDLLHRRSWVVHASFNISLQAFIDIFLRLFRCQYGFWAGSTLNKAHRHCTNESVSEIQRREWTHIGRCWWTLHIWYHPSLLWLLQ